MLASSRRVLSRVKMLLMSTCMVQEGRIPDGQRPELESALKDAVRRHVGPKARLAVAWITIPRGSGYAAGKPSTSSMVRVTVPDGFDQSAREALMHDVNDHWCRITGQSPFELLIGATDQTPGRAVIKSLVGQIPLRHKPRFLVSYARQAVSSLARGH
jgi:hypothetical protein